MKEINLTKKQLTDLIIYGETKIGTTLKLKALFPPGKPILKMLSPISLRSLSLLKNIEETVAKKTFPYKTIKLKNNRGT